ATHDPEVAVGVALCPVAGEVIAVVLGWEVAFLEAFWVAPDRADHGGPRAFHHQEAAAPRLDFAPRFVDDRRIDARQRQRARTRLERCSAGQRRDHVHAGFRLPPRVEYRAALATHIGEVPHPR